MDGNYRDSCLRVAVCSAANLRDGSKLSPGSLDRTMSKYSSSDCPVGMFRVAHGELASFVSNSSLQRFASPI